MSSNLGHGGDEWRADTQRLDVTLESSVDSANEAASLVVQFAQKQNYNKQQCYEIELAIRESVANAVLHGNGCDVSKKVFLTAEMQAPGLLVSIRDEGEGFDPSCVPHPLAADHCLQESGRGLFLMQAYMDEVTLRRSSAGGMEVALVKYRTGYRP